MNQATKYSYAKAAQQRINSLGIKTVKRDEDSYNVVAPDKTILGWVAKTWVRVGGAGWVRSTKQQSHVDTKAEAVWALVIDIENQAK